MRTNRGNEVTERRSIQSPWIGEIEWEQSSEIFFPHGLPGFEGERWLLPVEIPARRPLVYLQSTENPGVCFLCLPAQIVDPAFEPRLSEDERDVLELAENFPPVLGADLLCLAILIPSGSTVKTDLRSPIAINLHNYRGVQCVDLVGAEAGSRAFRLAETGRWEALCS